MSPKLAKYILPLCFTSIFFLVVNPSCGDKTEEPNPSDDEQTSSDKPMTNTEKGKRNQLFEKINEAASKAPCDVFPLEALKTVGIENVALPGKHYSTAPIFCVYNFGEIVKASEEVWQNRQELMEGSLELMDAICDDSTKSKKVEGLGVDAIACESFILSQAALVVTYRPGRVAVIIQHEGQLLKPGFDRFPAEHELLVARGILSHHTKK